jgi:hypothetical protein
MALAAAQVIDALAARLVPLTATAGRVHTSRAWPLTGVGLPAWRVTAADEVVEAATIDGINLHQLDVDAAATVRVAADLDDAMHALAAGGLALLFAAPVPYGLRLLGIGREITTEGEAAVGRITLRLQAQFYATPAAPETIYS